MPLPRAPRFATRSLCALAIAGAPLAAQSSEVRGVVVDSASGVGISGVEVRVEGSALFAFTDLQGRFQVAGDLPRDGVLRVRRLGFVPRSLPFARADTLLHLGLAPQVRHLAAVVVRGERTKHTGRLAGYYERLEHRTVGQFITRADLEREKPPQLSDMLKRTLGVQMGRNRGSIMGSVRMRGRDCAPLIWLDGAALGGADVDIDAFSPESIEGIELYLGASSAPQRYQASRGQSECGTVLLWSRGPDTDPIRRGASVAPAELEALIAAHTVYAADEVDLPAALDSASLASVAYPPSLRAAGIGGLVVAEFVVDARGRVEEANFNILSATSPLLMAAVQDAIRAAAFRPALRAGQAVRQVVRQPFEFHPPPR